MSDSFLPRPQEIKNIKKMDNYSAGAVGASAIALIGIIYKAVNHKKVRSRCCGKSFDVSLDIDPSVPTPSAPAPTVVAVAPPEALVLRQPPAPVAVSSASSVNT
jgi:hypothetical protein